MLNQEIDLALRKHPNLTVRQLVTQIGMKVRTFYRQWLEENTPKKFLAERRLELAKRCLLVDSDKKIADIARELQFCDHYYFSKWFRRKVGVSPKKFQMMTLKERVDLESKKSKNRRKGA